MQINTLAAWVHDLDPYALMLWEGGPIRWYGLAYLAGFLIGFLLLRRIVAVGVTPLRREDIGDLVVTLAIGVVVGGRLGYTIFYKPELWTTWSDTPPWWGVLMLQGGGMSSHGGILGTIAAAAFWSWRRRVDLPHVLDLLAFGAPLGLGVGRLANFVNGELFGRRAAESFPLAVKFPQEMEDWLALAIKGDQGARQRLYALGEVVPLIEPDATPATWRPLVSGALGRITEAQRGVYAAINDLIVATQSGTPRAAKVRAALDPLLYPRHPSQLYAALTEGLIVFAVLVWVWRRPRRPGLVGSWFCIMYAAMRIFNEQFRRPDMFLLEEEFAVLGVTRGQLLSVGILLLGLWGLWYSRRRAMRGIGPMGSWRRGPWTPVKVDRVDEA